MDEKTIEADVHALKPQETGPVATFTTAIADAAEHAVGSALDLGRLLRKTTFQIANAGIDALEAAAHAAFKATRDAAARGDRLSLEATESVEAAARSLTRVLRGSSEAASDLAARASSAFAGKGVSASAA